MPNLRNPEKPNLRNPGNSSVFAATPEGWGKICSNMAWVKAAHIVTKSQLKNLSWSRNNSQIEKKNLGVYFVRAEALSTTNSLAGALICSALGIISDD